MDVPKQNGPGVSKGPPTPEPVIPESNITVPEPSLLNPEAEADDEVRLAIEMALAAAQNPKLSPQELKKMVAAKNKQVEIVDQVAHQKEQEKLKEREEAQKRWNEQKEKAMTWWKGKTAAVSQTAVELKHAASEKAEELKDRAERRRFAGEIKRDEQIIDARKKIKVLYKTLKAHRLQGNRVETRHVFKRQRLERKLIHLYERLGKTQNLFTGTGYNIHEYAKAMMRASKKWRRKGTDQELALEAQLCRNMHQMLAIEKQKSKCKKTTREIKKYLQRCKGWLSDKKAFCEMHMMTLDATTNSMKLMYEEILERQNALIAKHKSSEEFMEADLSTVDVSHFDHLPASGGPRAMLSALRGLPINDSIRLKKDDTMVKPPPQQMVDQTPAQQNRCRKELFIETKDEASDVSSHLSDPDEQGGRHPKDSDSLSSGSAAGFDFGNDAPWMMSESDLDVVPEDVEATAQNMQQPTSPLGLAPSSSSDGVKRQAITRMDSKTASEVSDLTEGVKSPKAFTSFAEHDEEKSPALASHDAKKPSSTKPGLIEHDKENAPTSGTAPFVEHDEEVPPTEAEDANDPRSAFSEYEEEEGATQEKPAPVDSQINKDDAVPSPIFSAEEKKQDSCFTTGFTVEDAAPAFSTQNVFSPSEQDDVEPFEEKAPRAANEFQGFTTEDTAPESTNGFSAFSTEKNQEISEHSGGSSTKEAPAAYLPTFMSAQEAAAAAGGDHIDDSLHYSVLSADQAESVLAGEDVTTSSKYMSDPSINSSLESPKQAARPKIESKMTDETIPFSGEEEGSVHSNNSYGYSEDSGED